MALFNKFDLVYNDYKWSAYPDDNPHVTGGLDHTQLNRHEGYEILYFINAYMKEKGFSATSAGHKIEKMIREKVPHSIRNQKEIKEWIDKNW